MSRPPAAGTSPHVVQKRKVPRENHIKRAPSPPTSPPGETSTRAGTKPFLSDLTRTDSGAFFVAALTSRHVSGSVSTDPS